MAVAVQKPRRSAAACESRGVYRGSHGGAGEPGHLPVFTKPGDPRRPERLQRHAVDGRSGQPLTFRDLCSCGAPSHADCYATPDRLIGQLTCEGPEFAHLQLKDFNAVAAGPAHENGELTAAGKVFWIGGAALGLALASMMTNVKSRTACRIPPGTTRSS
jgi:hypothetical protein